MFYWLWEILHAGFFKCALWPDVKISIKKELKMTKNSDLNWFVTFNKIWATESYFCIKVSY